ncbi:MAG: ATP-binding cassette domain-containing protein [Eubacteriales bacterium]
MYYSETAKGIENVNLSIYEGEIFGFIGPNGSGKSTTIRTLLNFIYPTGGSAKVFDMDIVQKAKKIRKIVGYLPSEIFYYDDMTSKDLLRYSAKFYGKVDETRIKDLSNKLQLDLNKKIEDLSFGNRKKLGIVQTLLHNPKLIILDEPTSGLDPIMQNIFFDLLKEEREKGTTIFFSSHILSEVQKLCDRVAIIKEGEIIQTDSIEDLRNNNFKKVKIVLEDDTYDINIEGITNKFKKGNEISFMYNGHSKKLINVLKDVEIIDLLIEEPSLEEIFMHYYTD